MKKWILIQLIEGDVYPRGAFDTPQEATDEMVKQFLEMTGDASLEDFHRRCEYEDVGAFCNDVSAWGHGKWNEAVDWQIFEIEV